MAGIGEALAYMFAGGAGEYAGNRGQEIRDEDKARLAEAREMKMMQLQQQYQTSEREATQKYGTSEREATQQFSAGESQKDRDFRAQQQANQISATASEGAKDRASREKMSAEKAEIDPKNGKKLQGVPVQEEVDGEKTGRWIQWYKDGSGRVLTAEELEGGNTPTRAEKQNDKAAEDAYAKKRVDEKAGLLSSDKEDFKEYGGSRAKAEEAFRQEYRANQGKGESGTKAEAPPADQSLYTPQQQALIGKVKAKYPDASDEEIVSALKSNPKTAAAFQ
nr:MAG: hypothetical protein [Bacteriophage sp.]